MDTRQLKTLYDRLLDQQDYPGDVCPTDRNLVRLTEGSCSQAERQRMEAHFAECHECLELASKLQAADQWFGENQPQVFAGIEHKAVLAQVEPWASCPAPEILHRYADGAVPASPAGDLFRGRIDRHLAACDTCREKESAYRPGLAKTLMMTLRQLRDAAGDSVDRVRQMLLGVQAMAVACGSGHGARAMPGYRGQTGPTMSAPVVDAEGRLVLDDDGEPRHAKFELIRAGIERDGHFVLDLSTADRNFWQTADRNFVVCATLQHEHYKLILPTEKIHADGRITIVGNMVSGVEIRDLPLAAIELSVTLTGEPGQGSADST